jgi:hypothetical protein
MRASSLLQTVIGGDEASQGFGRRALTSAGPITFFVCIMIDDALQ